MNLMICLEGGLDLKRFSRKYSGLMGISITAEFIYTALTTIVPIIAGIMLDAGLQYAGDLRTIPILNIIMAAMGLMLLVILFGSIRTMARERYLKYIRTDLENYFISLFFRTNTGKARAINILHKKSDILMSNFFERRLDYVKAVVTLFIAFAYSAAVSWTALLLVAGCFITAITLNQILLAPFARRVEKYLKENEKMNRSLIGFLGAIRTVSLFGGLSFVKHRACKVLDKKIAAEKNIIKMRLVIETANSLMELLIKIVPIIILSIMYISDSISLGSALAMLMLFDKILKPIEQIAAIQQDIAKTRTIRNDLTKMIEADSGYNPCVQDYKWDEDLGISIENMSFGYGDNLVFKSASFEFRPGKKYLIVGENGSGKSTLFKLLMGEVSGYKGSIKIGGEEISGLAPCQLFAGLGMMHGGYEILYDTVERNISLSNIINEDKMREAAEFAGLRSGIRNQYLNYGGEGFSTLDLQGIALARAHYHRRPLYLFDEITSGLDPKFAQQTERRVLGFPSSIIIHISHLTDDLLDQYDEIVKIEAGKLVKLNKIISR